MSPANIFVSIVKRRFTVQMIIVVPPVSFSIKVFKTSRIGREKVKINPLYQNLDHDLSIYNHSQETIGLVFKFYIEEMNCTSCVHILEQLPALDSNILNSRSFFSESQLWVEARPGVSLAKVCTLIKEMGYNFHLIPPGEQTLEIARKESRKQLIQIAVAGASAAQVMMFTVPLYTGVDEQLKPLFLWLSLLFFLPIPFFAAQSFYKNAWISIKHHKLSIDLPLTIALWMGFLFSAWNVLQGSDDIYFDSTSSFIFLILVSRFFLKKAQQKLQRQMTSFVSLWPLQLQHIKGDWISVSQIKPGQELRLPAQTYLPVDARLTSHRAAFDTSIATGESLPQVFANEQKLRSGFYSLENCTVVAESQMQDSALYKLLQQTEQELLSKSKRLNQFDLVSHWLLALLLFAHFICFYLVFKRKSRRGDSKNSRPTCRRLPLRLSFCSAFSIHSGAQEG